MGGELPSSPGQMESVQTSQPPTKVAHLGSVLYREVQRSLSLPFLMKGNTQLPQLPVLLSAELRQYTLQSLDPASFLLSSLKNSTTMLEVEVNTKFFFFPQTLKRTSLESAMTSSAVLQS